MSHRGITLRREGRVRRGRTAGFTIALAAVGCVTILLTAALFLPLDARADAWEDRIASKVVKLETKLAELDRGTAATGDLTVRVQDLDRRVGILEKAKGLPIGAETIAEGERPQVLLSLTTAVVSLEKRIRKLEADQDEEPERPVEAAEPEPTEEAPDREGWPERLSFSASGSITYEAIGTYHYDLEGYLQTGWQGYFALSVRALGLKRQIKEAGIVFRATPSKMFLPFVNRVVWRARRSLWNRAVKTWPYQDSGRSDGPVQWISREESRRTHRMQCRVEAHVTYVIDRRGKRFEFKVPESILETLQRHQ